MASDIKEGAYTEGYENRALRRIFGLKRDIVTGGGSLEKTP
jgi:hypothetical protein